METKTQDVASESRRNFLRTGVQVVAGMGAFVAALEPLKALDPDDFGGIEGFLQKHYKELDEDEIEDALRRIEADVKRRFDVDAVARDVKPLDGVEFVYALNLSRCVGCRKCVHACVGENNQSRSPEIQYIRVLEMPKGTLDVEKGNHHYDKKR